MAIHYQATNIHWNYFLSLEIDFHTTSRYVEPCDSNNDTFSIEFARLIMAATQEVDVVMKAWCMLIDANASASGINRYHQVLDGRINDLMQEEVSIRRFGMTSRPWGSWQVGWPPEWWTSNNKIKHHRETEFHRATLKNAYNSLSGLLVAIAYFYYEEKWTANPSTSWWDVTDDLCPDRNLFRLSDDRYRGAIVMGGSPEW